MSLDRPLLHLSEDFKYALDRIEKSSNHLFITGRAGTGKSTLLRLFRQTTRKKVVVLAPTGIAALNVQGQTIHSFFKFPPKLFGKKDIKNLRRNKLYQKIEVLVIDEISMVRSDMLDNIDYFLRVNRENIAPFGGVQMVFFGDLFQLPPVVATDVERHLFNGGQYDSPFFFSAKILQTGLELETIELQRVYRQDARRFIRLLDAVRTNRIDYDDLEDLNERYLPNFKSEESYITLSARNATVNSINSTALAAIPLPELTFVAEVKGNFQERLFPTDAILRLKLSAQVMFLKNDPDGNFVNGTIGKIVKLEENKITVLVEDDAGERKYIDVEKVEWDIVRYKTDERPDTDIETEVAGTFKQYPLRLAWALTIHKAQGKTFDRVIIDLGRGAFEHGQTYVALSRCRTLDGIVLKKPLRPQDVMVDERIVQFYETNF